MSKTFVLCVTFGGFYVVSGMSSNNLLLQILADNIGIPVLRPSMPETSALGAAIMGKNATLSSHQISSLP